MDTVISLLIMFVVALVAAWLFVLAHYKLDFVAELAGR